MQYKGIDNFDHKSQPCIGVLITNLGTPEMPTAAALRRYLAEFLSDPRVIEIPKIIWWFILHGIILRIKPSVSAKTYKKIWTKNGSPLMDISLKQVNAIQQLLDKNTKFPIKIELGMRYGNPSIKSGLTKLFNANARRILVFPLYPQYCAATTASTFDAVTKELQTWRWIPELRMINHYHDDDGYILALANSIKKYWQKHPKPEKLIFSFHGIPKKYFLKGDPYYCECQKTAKLVAAKLQIDEKDWMITFQSQFGKSEWLKPYTDTTLKQIAKEGIKTVHVICPGFSTDCLETIEEINMQNREVFIKAGGSNFSYIPALNDQTEHIEILKNLILTHCKGWEKTAG